MSSCAEGGIWPDDTGVHECHGTGTALGDPIEVGGLIQVCAATAPPSDTSLWFILAKTSAKHLEIFAGSVGFIKCILILRNAIVPPNLHLRQLNPHLALHAFSENIPSDAVLKAHVHVLAGVSSFGFGGTNAHALLQHGDRPSWWIGEQQMMRFSPYKFHWRHILQPVLGHLCNISLGLMLGDRPISPRSMR